MKTERKILMATLLHFLLIFALLLQESYGKEFHIRNLECFNDYASELTCSWEVANSSSNCSADFQLKYETQWMPQQVCIPQNRQNGGTVVPNQCVCTMSGFDIVALVKFSVNLESNGRSVQSGVFLALDTVIPKVPRNIAVTSGNEDNIIVTWDNGYSGSKANFLSSYLNYNILITCKQDPTLFESINVRNRYCQINKRYFKAGCDYEVKVRSNFKLEEDGFQTLPWSDWSSAVEWHNAKEFHIRNLECFNDYVSELTCSWEVANSSSNCSADFQLKYETQWVPQNICIPQNRQNGIDEVPNQCVCTMSGFDIVARVNFIVNLESNGRLVQSGVFPALETVIPKVPRNVTVTSGNEDNIIVTWDNGYSGSKHNFLSTDLMYNMLITCKQNPTLFESINVRSKYCHINKRYFKAGCDYEVKVRSNYKREEDGFQTLPWSDWSSAVEWHNDYSPSFDYIPSIVVPVCCFLLFLLILLCYCIINICKKKWWQNIPDPAKSSLHLIRRHMSQETVVKSDENDNISPPSNKRENAKRICTNWFNKLFFKAHHKKHLSQNCTSKVYGNTCRKEDTWYSVLVPEVSVVEIATVENHLPESRKNSVNETKDIVEDKDEKQPFFDPSIDQMFQDIIDDSPFKAHGSSTTRDTLKNSNNNILLFSAFLEDHPAPLEVIQESPYRSYPGENFETDLPTKSDHCKFSGMDQCSADQLDSLCFTPQESLYQASEKKLDNGYANNGCQANTCCDSGYSSFASAVSGSENYSVSSENATDKDNELSNTRSCLPRSAFGNSNSSLHSDTTDSSAYYNRQSKFFLPDTSCDTSDMNIDLTLTQIPEDFKTSTEEESEVSSFMNICAVSNYHSFAEAIKQDGTSVNHHSEILANSMLESGYKSFESLLNQNTQETESDTKSCLCDLDIGVQKEEPTQSSAQNTGTNEFNKMKNTDGQTKIDFAEAPVHEITFGFLNLHLTENCLDNDCKESTEDKQLFSPKDSSDQIQDNAMKAEDPQNDFDLCYQGDTNCHLPFAWTNDLSEQWKHLANMYGPDFPQSSPVGKIDRIIRGSLSNHNDQGKSNVTETDIGVFPHQPAFSDNNNTSDCQTMKFANMSYFVHPCNELNTKLNDTQDDFGTFSKHTPEHHKNHENDGCPYMQISLS